MRNILLPFLVMTIAAVPSTCSADTPPPTQPFTAMSWPALSKSKPTIGLDMGAFKVEFEKTTLAMTIDAAGVGKIEQQGDAGEHILWVCYTLATPKQTERVWLISSGEMGGPKHAITEISAQTIQSKEKNDDCPSLPLAMQPVSFANGVWLGEKQSYAIKTLGKPSHQDKSWTIFDFEGKLPGTCEPDGYDVMNWFLFNSNNGRLITILAGQVTSC